MTSASGSRGGSLRVPDGTHSAPCRFNSTTVGLLATPLHEQAAALEVWIRTAGG